MAEQVDSMRREQRRAWPRLSLERQAHFDFMGTGRFATTRDIGCNGIYLKTVKPLERGARLHMRLSLDEQRRPLAVAGTVVRTEEGSGMAVRLGDDARTRAEIATYLLATLVSKQPLPLTEELSSESLARWKGLARLSQSKLDRTSWALARRQQENEQLANELDERAHALEHHEACLMMLDKQLQERELELTQRERSLDQRMMDLDARARKLLELSKRLHRDE
jgi:hypothetical protein